MHIYLLPMRKVKASHNSAHVQHLNESYVLFLKPLNTKYRPIRKWKVGCPWAAHVLHTGCQLKQWSAQWTGAAHYLCKLIIISTHELYMSSSVGRSYPLTFNLFIISNHGLHTGCQLKQWSAQWTGAAHYLCKLIIIYTHGLHMSSSVGRSYPLTFNLFIISNHGLPMGSSDC